jgi:hypothetical protein
VGYLCFLLCVVGTSLGSITLTRALLCGWLNVSSVISMAFPVGIWFMILFMRAFFDSVLFPMSMTLYLGVLFLGIVFHLLFWFFEYHCSVWCC